VEEHVRQIHALSVAALLLGPAAVHATIMSGSFSATMTAGTDQNNLFGGGAGSDLTGDAVTGTFVYDTTNFARRRRWAGRKPIPLRRQAL
jgi:hypothetical protein